MPTAAKRLKKQKGRVEAPTARPKTERIAVSSPTVPGAREEVEYVPGHVDNMRARKQFGQSKSENEFAFRAADRLRRAHETLYGAVGGVMDFDRVRGRGAAPAAPHESYLQAAETMSEAKQFLYPLDYRCVELCVCNGFTIEQAAAVIRRRTPTRADREEIARCLRQGLQQLAQRWFGSGERHDRHAGVRSWRDPQNETTPAVAGVVEVGGVYVGGGRG
jgi:hypothetical protein